MSCELLCGFWREVWKGHCLQPLPLGDQGELCSQAPEGTVVCRSCCPDSWIDLLLSWQMSTQLGRERSSTACSLVPCKSIACAKLVVEHTHSSDVPPPPAFLCTELIWPFGRPCVWASWNSPFGDWAWQALASDSKMAPSDIPLKEWRAKPGELGSASSQVHEHSRRF